MSKKFWSLSESFKKILPLRNGKKYFPRENELRSLEMRLRLVSNVAKEFFSSFVLEGKQGRGEVVSGCRIQWWVRLPGSQRRSALGPPLGLR